MVRSSYGTHHVTERIRVNDATPSCSMLAFILAVRRQNFRGVRSFSTVLVQVVLGWPVVFLSSSGLLHFGPLDSSLILVFRRPRAFRIVEESYTIVTLVLNTTVY